MSKYPTEKECQKFDFSKYRLIRSKAIRMKCLDCCGYQESEVRMCGAKSCPLWSYRNGHAEEIKTVTLSQLRKNGK